MDKYRVEEEGTDFCLYINDKMVYSHYDPDIFYTSLYENYREAYDFLIKVDG